MAERSNTCSSQQVLSSVELLLAYVMTTNAAFNEDSKPNTASLTGERGLSADQVTLLISTPRLR